MANKSKTNQKNKNLIIGICAALAVVVVIVVAVVLIANNTGINDSYFVSDGSKYVLTIDNSDSDTTEDDAYTPLKTHIVYTYSGDAITSLKTYYEYKDADAAKAAFDYMSQETDEEVGKIELNGKYVVITSPEDQYKDLTANDVKEQIDFMNSLQDMDFDEYEDANEVEDGGEVVESVEVEEEVQE